MDNQRWKELQQQAEILEFRAFHREYGMIYPNEYFTLNAIGGDMDFFGSPVKDWDTTDFIYSRYVGLKDKHGTKVYSGDIVKAVLINEYNQHIEVIEEVTIHEGLLAPFYMRVCYKEEWWKDRLLDGFEVIGNIYESPELLEG